MFLVEREQNGFFMIRRHGLSVRRAAYFSRDL